MKATQTVEEKNAIAEFIKTRGVTICPPAIVGPVNYLVKKAVAKQRRDKRRLNITSADVSSPSELAANEWGIESHARLPEEVRKEILAFMGISNFDSVCGLGSVQNLEEIWEPEHFFLVLKMWDDVSTADFSWGRVAIGSLMINGRIIRAFFDQNAAPVMFYVVETPDL